MTFQTRSDRLNRLPKYLFAELDQKMRELIAKGVDVINLGIGDPDLPPPERMIEALRESLARPEYHQYPAYNGADFFRKTAALWLQKYHSVTVDPESEVLTLIGSKEGLAHLPHAILNSGDTVLIADPCYPVHLQSILLAGAHPIRIPLTETNGFLPDLGAISRSDLESAKLLVINYPNNPTSATATAEFFREAVGLAHQYGFIICQDAAYIDICFSDDRQPSILSIPGAKEVAIEFYSLSKTFNVTGWRLGFAAGHPEIIASLGKYKTAIDSGQFTGLQAAGAAGLRDCMPHLKKTLQIYHERRKILESGLDDMGLSYFKSRSTFYVWCRVPKDHTSTSYADTLLTKLGIVAAPGGGFGSAGDDYIRFSLTSPTERIQDATNRMKSA